ncbi:uncharacterized protein Dmoj_GI25771 [Drosophila mojavensis]|uniref:Acp21a n=1 Tax=Drosophila mojavensis TaxID=7230 RepID=A0A0Q9XFL7_DROMO|nr:uncharacterized protein Dmoj_GI25771 [Drosophila mojavensis]
MKPAIFYTIVLLGLGLVPIEARSNDDGGISKNYLVLTKSSLPDPSPRSDSTPVGDEVSLGGTSLKVLAG